MTTTPVPNKNALTAAPILPALAERWSPRAYDPTYKLTQHELLSVLEAARWAPSANNGQPVRYSVITREDKLHDAVVAGLTGFNQGWAPAASAIIVVSIVRANADGTPHRSARYDAGLAVGNLMAQAQDLGLHTHNVGGVVHDQLHEALGLPDELEVLLAVTIGKVTTPDVLNEAARERELQPRTRLALEDIVLHGRP